MRSQDFVVVGCGISGAALAWNLRRRGAGRVMLVERGEPASGGTGKSAAIVRQHYSTPLMARLARRSVELFAGMEQALGQDPGYRKSGYLFLATPENADAARANIAMQRGLGIDTRWVPADELASLHPWISTEGVAGAASEAAGGYADPVRSVEAYLEAFRREGGEARTRLSCRGLLRRGDRIAGIVTDEGPVEAGCVVNAAGPWAPRLARLAGIDIPMRSLREQDTVWEGRGGRELPDRSVSNSVDAIYLRPQGDRRFVVGRGFPKPYEEVDEENYKQTPDDDFVADVQERMERRFPVLQGARLIHAYTALYDATPDWYPFVGPRSGLAGYADFCGGSGHGFKIAPAIAEELAAWLVDGRAADDFRQLSHDRVGEGRLFVQSYGGNRG